MNSNMYKKKIDQGSCSRILGKTILNLDNKGPGTHWTAIAPYSKNCLEPILKYSDSFGVPPPFKLPNTLILFNPWVVQKDNEVNCGERALNFLHKIK